MTDLDFHGISIPQIINSYQKQFYKKQIDLFVKNKIVVDLGAGSGILSFMAVESGAKKVYAIEKNIIVCQLLKKAIKKLGWEDKIFVLNKDFIHDDLSEWFNESEVCVSEIINTSFTNNIFPYVIKNIKNNYKHLKIIPDHFSYRLRVIQSEYLNKTIQWNYNNQFDSVFDKIYLDFTIYQPLKLYDNKWKKQIITTTDSAIAYDFNGNIITNNTLVLPLEKKQYWLEIGWHFDKKIFNSYWQCEYIPLCIDWFNNVDSITIIPKEFTHIIQKQCEQLQL
jgi:predicted RNA methylase